jgi:hypothetical protein
MFCPKCGNADQLPDTFCRQCGNYLYDYDKNAKRKHTPEEHLKVNATLSLMTAIVSITLSILLFSIVFSRNDMPFTIYLTAGFLIAIFAWQVQTFWRSLLLKKHFKKQKRPTEFSEENKAEPQVFESKPTNPLLTEADYDNFVPPSVVEKTTRKLRSEKR